MSFKIVVTVKPQSRSVAVKQINEKDFEVCVRAPAREGKANRAVIDLLADHFSVPKSAVRIVHGQAARRKLFEIG